MRPTNGRAVFHVVTSSGAEATRQEALLCWPTCVGGNEYEDGDGAIGYGSAERDGRV
jgi:hypothetical protein